MFIGFISFYFKIIYFKINQLNQDVRKETKDKTKVFHQIKKEDCTNENKSQPQQRLLVYSFQPTSVYYLTY